MQKSGLIGAMHDTVRAIDRARASVAAVVARGDEFNAATSPTAAAGESGIDNFTQRGTHASPPIVSDAAVRRGAPPCTELVDVSTTEKARRILAPDGACPVDKVARCTPDPRGPLCARARYTAKRSANKAVRRAPATRPAKHAPARKAAKLSAKKAVRRA